MRKENYEIEQLSVEIIKEKSFEELANIFNAKNDSSESLLRKAYNLLELKGKHKYCTKRFIKKHEKVLDAFSKICLAFHYKYIEEQSPTEKKKRLLYVEAAQIIHSMLQNQFNQLIYQRQVSLAWISIIVTIISSIASIILSITSEEFRHLLVKTLSLL